MFGHVARLLNPEWSVEKSGIAVCRVSGKGSFRRYREFFEAFEVDVAIFGDLDCLLESFDKLELPEEIGTARNALLEHLDKLVEEGGVVGKLSAEALRKFAESPSRRSLWEKLKGTLERWKEGKASQEELQAAEAGFFSKETMTARRSVLEESTDPELISRKRSLLSVMRQHRVYVLEKGSIEKYFPPGIEGKDKPARALNFISKVKTREEVLKLCAEVPVPESGETQNELDMIFAGVLNPPSSKGPVLGAMVEL